MKKILIGLLAITLLVGCWDAKPPPESTIIARLEVTPNALLLEKVGASSKLKVTAFNASNQTISNPQVALRELMREHELKQTDMVEVFGSQGVVSQVLNGKREISKAQARKLSERFRLSVDIFI